MLSLVPIPAAYSVPPLHAPLAHRVWVPPPPRRPSSTLPTSSRTARSLCMRVSWQRWVTRLAGQGSSALPLPSLPLAWSPHVWQCPDTVAAKPPALGCTRRRLPTPFCLTLPPALRRRQPGRRGPADGLQQEEGGRPQAVAAGLPARHLPGPHSRHHLLLQLCAQGGAQGGAQRGRENAYELSMQHR